jgi:hypothetical protein
MKWAACNRYQQQLTMSMVVACCLTALQASIAFAVVDSAVDTATTTTKAPTDTPITLPETAAESAIRKLPKEVVNAPRARRFSLVAQRAQEESSKRGVDEIVVYGRGDPEDFVSKRAPMLAFRDRLDRTPSPMTPAQKAQLALCLIGLCGLGYGADGIPVENTAYTRAEKNKDKSSLQQSMQFRGTFQ